MNRLLIDTNIYSLAMRGDDETISMLRHTPHLGICAISIGELLSGFKGGSQEKKNRHELRQFLDSPRVVLYPLDEDTADYYSSILSNLKKQGTPIPTNDIWIAASAFQHGLALCSQEQHFNHIAGLLRYPATAL